MHDIKIHILVLNKTNFFTIQVLTIEGYNFEKKKLIVV